MTDFFEMAKEKIRQAAKLAEELPLCRKCQCNWPKSYIDANGLCPNCRTGEKP